MQLLHSHCSVQSKMKGKRFQPKPGTSPQPLASALCAIRCCPAVRPVCTWSAPGPRIYVIKEDNSLGNHFILRGGSPWASQCLWCCQRCSVTSWTDRLSSSHGILQECSLGWRATDLPPSSPHYALSAQPSLVCADLSSVLGRAGTWVHAQQMCSSVKELKYRTNKVFPFWKSPLPCKDCKATFLSNTKGQINHGHKCCLSRALKLEPFAIAGSLCWVPQRIKASSPGEMQWNVSVCNGESEQKCQRWDCWPPEQG